MLTIMLVVIVILAMNYYDLKKEHEKLKEQLRKYQNGNANQANQYGNANQANQYGNANQANQYGNPNQGNANYVNQANQYGNANQANQYGNPNQGNANYVNQANQHGNVNQANQYGYPNQGNANQANQYGYPNQMNQYQYAYQYNVNQVNVKKKNPREVKNELILMTGAILIVLAAIVFLASTWNTIPNILKTLVLTFLIGVFLGLSSIADKKFKLTNTSNTFLYIAMVYIPILMVSISAFGLLGEYLSIHGEGKYIYYFVTSLLLTIIYTYVGIKRKKRFLLNISMIVHLLVVIFLTLVFTTKVQAVIMSLCIYTLLLIIISKKFDFKNYSKQVKNFANTYLFSLGVISALSLLDYGVQLENLVSTIILLIGFIIKALEDENSAFTSGMLFYLLITVFSIVNLKFLNFSIGLKQLIMVLTIFDIYIYGIWCLNLKKSKEITFINTIISMVIVYLYTKCNYKNVFIIKDYMIMYISLILAIINYVKAKTYPNATAIIISIVAFIAGIETINALNISFNYLILISLIILAIPTILKNKDKVLSKNFAIMGNIAVGLSILINLCNDSKGFINCITLHLVTFVVYIILYLKNLNKPIYKIISYIYLNIIFASIFSLFNLNELYIYTTCISTIIIIGLELAIKEIRDNTSNVYVILLSIFTFIALNVKILTSTDIWMPFVMLMLLCICYIFYVKINKINKVANIAPAIALVPNLYWGKIITTNGTNLMSIFALIFVILLSVISIKNKKFNYYTVTSALSLILYIYDYQINIYLGLVLVTAYSFAHLMTRSEQNVNEYLNNGFKVIEYILYLVIYTYANFSYKSEIEAMIFIFLIVLITIFSYIKKYGPIFLSGIIAILVNLFLLTKEFWFSIPWWGYLLLVGIMLIAFAIRNELRENKNNELKEKLRKFKGDMRI